MVFSDREQKSLFSAFITLSNGKRKVPQIEWHDKKATNAVHTTAFIT